MRTKVRCLQYDATVFDDDIGEIDEAGHLKITGRKKELIVSAYGKNIQDPVNYDMVLNAERMDVEVMADAIISAAKGGAAGS